MPGELPDDDVLRSGLLVRVFDEDLVRREIEVLMGEVDGEAGGLAVATQDVSNLGETGFIPVVEIRGVVKVGERFV
jgi:hypothetical protein